MPTYTNTFKKGDLITIARQPDLGSVKVKYIDGPFVYYEHPYYPRANCYATSCTLVKEATLGDILATALDKPKFKVGDRVKHQFDKHCIHFVKDVRPHDGYILLRDFTNAGYFAPSNFTLAATATPSIVARFESGVYKPSARPVLHATKEAAIEEAERLARKHPGSEFATFTIAARTTSNKPLPPTPTVTTVSV